MSERNDIYLLRQYSNWSEQGIDQALKESVYRPFVSWAFFLRIFFLSIGVSFVALAIVFFFAYNWASLHKFIKIGIIESLLLLICGLIVFTKWNDVVKNILLTSISLLVGVLFGVFGQIYQTGADAYDFFIGWTICISIWVVISNFSALWLLYIGLINTSIYLFFEQTQNGISDNLIFLFIFLFNLIVLSFSISYNEYKKNLIIPNWFIYVVGSVALCFSTLGMVFGMFTPGKYFTLLALVTFLSYLGGMIYGVLKNQRFFIAAIAYSFIIISSAFFIKQSDDALMFLFVTVYIVFTVWIVTHLILFGNRISKS
ncbi:DUF2157 domain-containing protein [Leptospira sp. GIMC2001]|uniref:DUF2157 domain-containing protein n=1 Tax=Leptospira sp. GIMC2001 TaxID=1513297 RepID=UPI0023498299|nr:DUF2157 domain-containing protein [Leptospira sp. GIMC2001]WCL47659.1 DUF2157 domain-containing protein [Leptospira sp. GIMC2001]